MLRVVIIGYGEMFTSLIAGALDANCNIVGVFRREMLKYPPVVRKVVDIINPSTDYNYIKSYNLPEIEAESVNSEKFRNKLLKLNPDIILVGSWSEKIEKATYDIPKIASINVHPSLLPKYRGPNPYFWTIRNGEKLSGLTFHLIDEGYDTGAILAQEEVEISQTDNGETLKRKTVLKARGMVFDLLNNLKEDIIIPLQQREDRASYFSHPEGLELDFTKSAEDNYNLIRASYPWCNCWFYNDIVPLIPDNKFIFIETNKSAYNEAGTVVECDSKNKIISVLCGDGNVLKMRVKLYKKIDRIFTSNYLKRDIKIGSVLI